MQAIPQEFLAAYQEYDREMTIRKTRLGCVIGIVMVPLFAVLDHFVYPDQALSFWVVRLACLILMVSLYQALGTAFGRRFYRAQGVLLLLMPSATVAWMVYATEGAASPYYAGLNLALMVLAVVLDWTFWQSLTSVVLVLLLYLFACLFSSPVSHLGIFINNLFFLVSTGVVIVAGSFFHTQLRIREFVTRHELDKNRVVLEETNQKLRELDQIKSRFFANISHELRTPLTLLLAPLETMLHRFNRSLDSQTRDVLVTMHSNGMRLLKLINDLLELVRLESGRMEVKRDRLPLAEFISGLASAARQVATDKRIQLETWVDEELGTVLADRDKLEKILLNLMFNALKFTPADGRVEVRAERQGEELVLSVKDTGVGISEKNLPFVFDRFWQADASSKRKYHGVGIGLALVKELVEIQRGTVSVESQEGKGATFTVRLPYLKAGPLREIDPAPSDEGPEAAAPATNGDPGTVSSEQWLSNLYRRAELFPSVMGVQDTSEPTETSRNGDYPKVLVADDEPDMRRFLRSQLSANYQVTEAVNGQQAIQKAGQFLPDIILLDMMMPEKDGLQACREIREHTPTQNIPIIILTARADEESKLAALSAGASDFLPKPFSTTELHVRIKNLIESFHYQRKLSRQNQVLEGTIEQLKETETQLVQTEKLASLGRLSAGIIHEINNPLNFATTGLYTLRNKGKLLAPEQQAEFGEILKDVEEGIQRVKMIVSDLRSFSHYDNDRIDQVEVSEAVTSALRFLSHEWKEVKVEQSLPEGQAIWANKNKLIQVLVNLLQNAVDSLKEKSFSDEKPTIWIQGRVADGKSILTVRDNGSGIEPAVLSKVFDPFFTTKDVGQGMGLGLSICYRIVQEYEGKISVKSEPGKFCEFHLEFPVKG